MEKIGIFISGKISDIVYDMNDADYIASNLKKEYPNKKITIRYI